jgi:hypothetical protein
VALFALGIIIHSMSDASRQKLFLSFLLICVGYFSPMRVSIPLRMRTIATFLSVIFLLLFSFEVIVAYRTHRSVKSLSYGTESIVEYYSLGLSALAPHVDRVPNPNTGGEVTFGAWYHWAFLVGLTDPPRTLAVYDWEFFQRTGTPIGRCGLTSLGWLVADFGQDDVWFGQALLMLLSALLAHFYHHRGLTGHVISLAATFGALYTTFSMWITTQFFVYIILWTAIISHFATKPQHVSQISSPIVSSQIQHHSRFH